MQPVVAAVAEPTTWLGNWFGTVLFWRPQLALVVNERTLFPVVMPLAPAATVLDRFPVAFGETLARAGVERRFIDAEVAEMRQGRWAKTANRSMLGVMNEFSFLADQIRRDRDTDPMGLAAPCVGRVARAASRCVGSLLTPLQTRLIEIITALPEARGFALAGAGGLIVHGVIERATQDFDYFMAPGDDRADARLRNALERALDDVGVSHLRRRDLPTFVTRGCRRRGSSRGGPHLRPWGAPTRGRHAWPDPRQRARNKGDSFRDGEQTPVGRAPANRPRSPDPESTKRSYH